MGEHEIIVTKNIEGSVGMKGSYRRVGLNDNNYYSKPTYINQIFHIRILTSFESITLDKTS